VWDTVWNIPPRQGKSRREYTAPDLQVIRDAHRAAFAAYVTEHLTGEEAETWRDHESDMSLEHVHRLRGLPIPTIVRRRRRLRPKLEALWRAWPYSAWRGNPDPPPLMYGRARRHDRDH
jgi:hypothetical protein